MEPTVSIARNVKYKGVQDLQFSLSLFNGLMLLRLLSHLLGVDEIRIATPDLRKQQRKYYKDGESVEDIEPCNLDVPAPPRQHPKKTALVVNHGPIVEVSDDSLHRTAGVPIRFERLLKANAEMIAPALPLAAEIP